MDGFGSPSSSSALKARYPMYVIPVKKLMQMKKFLIHREMMERNLLQEYTPETEGRVIVVSHQWLSYNHPDPDQEHFFTLKRLLDRLGNGEVNRVEDYWLHAVMFRSAGITAREWKNEFENTFVWIDYCCIPQVEVDMDPRTVTLSGLAVQSIAAYVERASLLLVLAPICVHKDSQQACNFSSWRKRGWCRLEMMSALLSARDVRVMVCQGAEATPFLLHPFEAPRMPVGDGDFSCCELGHNMGGHTMACDKQRLRGVMEEMLQAKVASYKGEGKAAEKMWWACMQGFLLKGLPEKEVSFCIPEGMSLFPDEEEDVEKLHHFLRQRFNTNRGLEAMKRMIGWTDYDKKRADASGFTLMMCAAISDNADAVHELAVRDITGNLVNQGLKRQFYHLAFMWKHVRPLGAAMAYASWETVQALLDSGADPRARAHNGMDAFFFACCLGNLENIKGWLKTFPTWDMDRTIPILGLSPLCAAVCSGAKKEPVLKVLIEARANLTQKRRWGGESSLLCMVANNEDSQCEALKLLLAHRCNVNAKWTAHTSFFAGALKDGQKNIARPTSGRVGCTARVNAIALRRQTWRCGDGKADVHSRNAEGRRPIDVARSFFGGQVPQPLAEALLADTDCTDEDEAQLHFIPHGVRHLRHFRQEKLSAIESEGSTASSERRSSTLISL